MNSSAEKSEPERDINTIAPDGGYGRIIVVAAFICHLLSNGISFSFSVFLIYFIDYYKASETDIVWIGSLLTGCTYIFGPISGALTCKFGNRPIVILGAAISSASIILSAVSPTLGMLKLTFAITGIGFGLTTLSSLTCVLPYFTSKRASAMGIVFAGGSIGLFVFPPLTHFLLESYDFRGAMIIFGALNLNCVAMGASMRPIKSPFQHQQQNKTVTEDISNLQANNRFNLKEQNETSETQCDDKLASNSYKTFTRSRVIISIRRLRKAVDTLLSLHLLKNKAFWLYNIGLLFGVIGHMTVVTYIVHNAVIKGIEQTKATFLMSAVAISNLSGKVLLGFICDIFKIRVLILHNIVLYICGTFIIVMTVCFTYATMLGICAVIGFTSAALFCFSPVISVQLIGLPELNQGIGLSMCVCGFSSLLSLPFLGFLFDVTGSYDVTFYTGGIGLIVHATLSSLILLIKK